MDRRRFLKLFGMATVGGAVAYSFPDIIVPKNIVPATTDQINFITRTEIYPKVIKDLFFEETSWLAHIRKNDLFDMIDKDMEQALETVSREIDKRIWGNPINESLFSKLGKPDFL